MKSSLESDGITQQKHQGNRHDMKNEPPQLGKHQVTKHFSPPEMGSRQAARRVNRGHPQEVHDPPPKAQKSPRSCHLAHLLTFSPVLASYGDTGTPPSPQRHHVSILTHIEEIS
jgi:hypothetical protein